MLARRGLKEKAPEKRPAAQMRKGSSPAGVGPAREERGGRTPPREAVSRRTRPVPAQRAGGPGSGPGRRPEQKAVLFEDRSSVIDYSSESGSIDPSLEKYKNIKRIGSGPCSVETGGITFYMGKKLYRYDFHRVRDIKAGKSHLALFLMGSGSVKLFIIEPGSGIPSLPPTRSGNT